MTYRFMSFLFGSVGQKENEDFVYKKKKVQTITFVLENIQGTIYKKVFILMDLLEIL